MNNTTGAGTAKRFRLKAQGRGPRAGSPRGVGALLQPWDKQVPIINPERVAPADATALRLNHPFNPVTQGSRSDNPGL